jgi:hypothetical protein
VRRQTDTLLPLLLLLLLLLLRVSGAVPAGDQVTASGVG